MAAAAASPSLAVQQPPGKGDGAGSFWHRVKALIKLSFYTRPVVGLVPLALLVVLLALGMMGLAIGISTTEANARRSAQYEVDSAVISMQISGERAILPLLQLTDYVNYNPNVSRLLPMASAIAPGYWRAAPPGALFFALVPQGFVDLTYPPNMITRGFNVLNPAFEFRNSSLASMDKDPGRVVLFGPMTLRGRQICTFTISIRIPTVSNHTLQDWGSNSSNPVCNEPGVHSKCAYNATTGTSWWGFSVLAIDMDAWFNASEALQALVKKGYEYHLTAMDATALTRYNFTGHDNPVPTKAVSATLTLAENNITVVIWQDCWTPKWMWPLTVAVVVGSLVISALVFALLLSREQHRVLLHSLLPKSTIARMREDIFFSEVEQQQAQRALRKVELETPARHMLTIISACLEEQWPSVQLLLNVREALHRAVDVYRPTSDTIRGRLQAATNVDDDTRQMLVNQLIENNATPGEIDPADKELPPWARSVDDPDAQEEDEGPGTLEGRKISTIIWTAATASQSPLPPLVPARNTASQSGKDGHEVPSASGPHSRPPLPLSPARLAKMSQDGTRSRNISSGEVVHVDGEETAVQGKTPSITSGAKGGHSSARLLVARQSGVQRASNQTATTHNSSSTHAITKSGRLSLRTYDSSLARDVSGAAHDLLTLMTPPYHGPSITRSSSASVSHFVSHPPASLSANHQHHVSGMQTLVEGQPLTQHAGGKQQQPASAGEDFTTLGLPNVTIQLAPSVDSKLEALLASADQWGFDVYALEEATQGHPLSVLSYWLLHKAGIIAWAQIDTTKLVRFLQRVEEGYPDNPYHNRRHAAEVLQSMHMLVTRGGLTPGFVDHQLVLLACYLSAIVHDYGHRGRNNDFLVASQDELAIQYNDRSPMENHHLAAAFMLLRQPGLDWISASSLGKAAWAKMRKHVIDMVLATDMKQHFAIVGQFDALHKNPSEPPASQANSADGHAPSSTSSDADAPPPPVEPISDVDKTLSLQMAIKCADLANLAAPLPVYLKWVQALEQEFFLQGDAEREAGLPISPLCDRTKEGVCKSQVGFFDFVVLPLVRAFVSRFPSARPLLTQMLSNYSYWKQSAPPPPPSAKADGDSCSSSSVDEGRFIKSNRSNGRMSNQPHMSGSQVPSHRTTGNGSVAEASGP